MMASCNGRCVRNRDRGFINPYDVTVGDHVIEPDANCLEHSRPAIPRVDANGWYYLIHPRSGWSAECEDCPYTIGLDYGQRIYPRAEFDDTDPDARAAAERWADEHRVEHPDHRPRVGSFYRWTMEIVDQHPNLLEAIFGPAGPPADTEHQEDHQ